MPPSSDATSRSGRGSSASSGLPSVVAGVVAGCVTRSCTSPLDVLKIVIQLNGPASAATSSASTSATPMGRLQARAASLSLRPLPRAAPSVLSRTVRELYALEGVRAFWRGNAAGCCRLGPYAGAKFFLFDSLQAQLAHGVNGGRELTNAQRALCGAAAGLVATMATYPLEVVRTRMIAQSTTRRAGQYIRGVAHGLRLIVRAEGLRGLYRGGCSGVAGAIPFEGAQFGCYEYLKLTSRARRWPASRWPEGKSELDGVDFFVCGSVAGAVAQTVAYPFDTVKKRLQVQSVVAHAPSAAAEASATANAMYYRGMVDCFRKVVRDEGPLALYRGTVPNLARIVPYAAVMFSTFELTKKALQTLCE
jgi:solute carrier family 25 phosphate transporter 23/24/25/41